MLTPKNDQPTIAGILKEAAENGKSLRLDQGNSIITGRIVRIDVERKEIKTKNSNYSFRIVDNENDPEFQKLFNKN
ncbi:MAG: hypothetical protein WCK37_03825 [Candidatus Falkowbacteria bacterium]